MIGIIDYGLGNTKAFCNMLDDVEIPNKLVADEQSFDNVQKIILPGVGSFDWALERLKAKGLFQTLNEMVLDRGMPVLGVCVGMQIIAVSSTEGKNEGFKWIEGRFVEWETSSNAVSLRSPHMGWNTVTLTSDHMLFAGMTDPEFYFLHSYYFVPDNEENVIARSDYGHSFPVAIFKDNIFGVQFHPEKSHDCGRKLLSNFWKYA